MFVEYIAILIKLMMNNHVYTFDGKIWLQDGKGSIGDEATCVISEWWVKTFKEKLHQLKIRHNLIERFVDDINGVFDKLP